MHLENFSKHKVKSEEHINSEKPRRIEPFSKRNMTSWTSHSTVEVEKHEENNRVAKERNRDFVI